ncbi:MAG: hypothetical protein WBR13_13000 [Allosphingosinicella sp.]
MGPFEVSKELIGRLSSMLLRSLLARLLEAEAKQRQIPAASISVGGNDAAADGGVDASITWTGQPAAGGWLPRRTTYFQCKTQKMAALDLHREMRPAGTLRPIFAELASRRGAYILFSTDDISHSGYERRMKAMAEAIEDLTGTRHVCLDFFGADRIPRWTNQHLGVALWLLEQMGRGLGGWRPAGQWSAPGAGSLPYLFDGNRRAIIGGRSADIHAAIIAMRDILSARPRGAPRSAGSTMGPIGRPQGREAYRPVGPARPRPGQPI